MKQSTSSYERMKLKMNLKRGDIISSKYVIEDKLGEGSFGKVYSAVDERGQKYAVKLAKSHDLEREKTVYEELSFDEFGNRATGIPRMYHFCSINGHDVLVLQKLGTSLHDKVQEQGGRLSLKTCLMIGIQAVSRVEYMHNKGFLHRDIKPDNFLTGRPGYGQRRIYIMDYGLCKSFREKGSGRHVRGGPGSFAGTVRFSSINVMKGLRGSRRDDLESLAYMLLEMRNGKLPWSRISGGERERKKAVLRAKMEVSISDLCCGFPGMRDFVRYVRRLSYDDRPSYETLRVYFRTALQELGFWDDGEFDWVTR